jgi:hypothetical protein
MCCDSWLFTSTSQHFTEQASVPAEYTGKHGQRLHQQSYVSGCFFSKEKTKHKLPLQRVSPHQPRSSKLCGLYSQEPSDLLKSSINFFLSASPTHMVLPRPCACWHRGENLNVSVEVGVSTIGANSTPSSALSHCTYRRDWSRDSSTTMAVCLEIHSLSCNLWKRATSLQPTKGQVSDPWNFNVLWVHLDTHVLVKSTWNICHDNLGLNQALIGVLW